MMISKRELGVKVRSVQLEIFTGSMQVRDNFVQTFERDRPSSI
jgi:hypothetical protein